MTTSLLTTFIIPHQGRTALLVQTIESIHKQTRFEWVDQIIVITKNTSPLTLPNHNKVTVLYVPEHVTISKQRNIGVARATSPYIAFLDADIRLAPEWLDICHRVLLENTERVLVSAMQVCDQTATGLEQVRAALSNIALEQPVQFLTGRNLLLTRKTFDQSGGFPEHLQTCEDYYFTEKVSEQGQLFYTNQTSYVHLGEDKHFGETFKKERWRSAYNLLSLRGRDIPLAEWPSILLPFWFMLASLLFLIGLIGGHAQLWLSAMVAWLLPVTLYSARLIRSSAEPLERLDVFKFYTTYFAGRMLGTVLGLPKLWLPNGKERTAADTPKQSLKVLEFICPAGFYGAERWIIALAQGALQSAQNRVDYHLAVTNEGAEPLEVSQHFQALGLPSHEIALKGRFDLRAISQLARLIQDQNIDIVHTHGYKSDIIGLLAAKIAGVPAVCTPHGFENAKDWKLKAYLWLGGLSFRFFDKLCPLSPQIAQDLEQIYAVPRQKIHPILNGVDLSEVQKVRESTPREKSDHFTIGYIGQLISRKNLADMLKSFALFSPKCPEARLQLLGDGQERQALQTLAQTLNIDSKVEFLGFQANRLAWLRQFDIFTMTSSLEGIPRCMMEAMAMGVPLAGFDIPGVNNLIRSGETGLSCTFGDCQALANLWLNLYESPELRTKLANSAKDYVYAHFSAQRMAENYDGLFHQLAGPVTVATQLSVTPLTETTNGSDT